MDDKDALAGSAPAETPDQQDRAESPGQSDAEQGQAASSPGKDSDQDGDGNASERPSRGGTVVARYGLMLQTGEFRYNIDSAPLPGTKVVVRTERGVELGEVIADICRDSNSICRGKCISSERLDAFLAESGPEYPFRRGGRILRIANPQDIIDHRHLESSAREEAVFCREHIRQLKLDMKLVSVEHLLGGERIIFYFASEGRVDFRELVRRLAGQYRTRIEMRQVGARDEARLVGDYERCGQQCCCQSFLKNLKPISMRMAKTQKATLDPSKISGRCGRLMCCLRYEDEGYTDLRKRLPKRNSWVRTEKLSGRVTDTQILTQLVRVTLPDNTQTVIPNEDIIERDVPPPRQQQAPVKAETPQPLAKRRRVKLYPSPEDQGDADDMTQTGESESVELPVADAPPEIPEVGPDVDEGEKSRPSKRHRRSRRKRPKTQAAGGSTAGGSAAGQPAANKAGSPKSSASSQSSKSRKRRRRRRKKKKPASGA